MRKALAYLITKIAFDGKRECDLKDMEQSGWATFDADTEYFGSKQQQVMINFRVDRLDDLLAKLKSAGVEIDPERSEDENGRMAWITDPEGNRVELWEPSHPRD